MRKSRYLPSGRCNVARIVSSDDVEHVSTVGGSSRHGTHMVFAPRKVQHASPRYSPRRSALYLRFRTAMLAFVCSRRCPSPSGAVNQSTGDGGTRSAARTASYLVGIPRVAGIAGVWVYTRGT